MASHELPDPLVQQTEVEVAFKLVLTRFRVITAWISAKDNALLL